MIDLWGKGSVILRKSQGKKEKVIENLVLTRFLSTFVPSYETKASTYATATNHQFAQNN